MKDSNKALLFTAIAIASWSTVASAFKIALRHYTHFELIFVSALTALLVFALVITFQKKWSQVRCLSRKQWLKFAFTGLLNPAAYYLVLFKSYDLLPAQIAQPINYFWPIVLAILLAVVSKQKIAGYKYIGMFVSFAGVALISLGTEAVSGASLSKLGIGLAFFSAFLWALFWIVSRGNRQIDNVVGLFASFFFGVIYLAVISFFVFVDLGSVKARCRVSMWAYLKQLSVK